MWIQYLLIVNLWIPLVISQDDDCPKNNQQQPTTCTELTYCEEARRQVKEKHYHGFQVCGYKGLMQMVCCPLSLQRLDNPGDNDGGKINIESRITIRVAERECNKIRNDTIPFISDHIINGEVAAMGEFPHMVGLGYPIEGEYQFKCGGSLVSFKYVLTAAHCVVRRIQPEIVRGGVINIGTGEENKDSDRRIKQIIEHPNYILPARYNDIALLRLEKPFELSSNLNPICLDTSTVDPEETLIITGWGQMHINYSNRSKILLKASIMAVAHDECYPHYSSSDWQLKLPQGIIAAKQICASDPKGMSDTCHGDSGGPLMTTTYEITPTHGKTTVAINRLVGITSLGRGCGSTLPALYTRVGSYLDWIERIVWPN